METRHTNTHTYIKEGEYPKVTVYAFCRLSPCCQCMVSFLTRVLFSLLVYFAPVSVTVGQKH